jgi:hypothetical protein
MPALRLITPENGHEINDVDKSATTYPQICAQQVGITGRMAKAPMKGMKAGAAAAMARGDKSQAGAAGAAGTLGALINIARHCAAAARRRHICVHCLVL